MAFYLDFNRSDGGTSKGIGGQTGGLVGGETVDGTPLWASSQVGSGINGWTPYGCTTTNPFVEFGGF